MRPLFSVIIVNFNGGDYLQKAVDSLKQQTFQNFEVFVVDNASTDGSMEQLDVSGIAHVHLMPEIVNHGFAKANNMAARRASGDWLALLNPDAVAADDWLEKVGDAIDKFPDVKMFASAQYAMHAPELMDGAGDCYSVIGFPWRGGFERPISEMPESGECFSPCGASAIFHKESFLKVGGFDEKLFCYCEDVDVAFRLRLQGERCLFLPDAKISHAGSALSSQVSHFAVWHGTRNRIWVYFKNMPPIAFWSMLIPHFLMTLLVFGKWTKNGKALPVLSAIKAAFKDIWPILHDRQRVQGQRTLSSWQIMKSMCWNPYTLIKKHVFVQPLRK